DGRLADVRVAVDGERRADAREARGVVRDIEDVVARAAPDRGRAGDAPDVDGVVARARDDAGRVVHRAGDGESVAARAEAHIERLDLVEVDDAAGAHAQAGEGA